MSNDNTVAALQYTLLRVTIERDELLATLSDVSDTLYRASVATQERILAAEKEPHPKQDKCSQCTMPITDSYTGRTDLLCEYHAGE